MGKLDAIITEFPVYEIYCPVREHQKFPIGELSGDINRFDHIGCNCPMCQKMKKFNQKNLKKNLQNGTIKIKN